jgi:hypothetical protein
MLTEAETGVTILIAAALGSAVGICADYLCAGDDRPGTPSIAPSQYLVIIGGSGATRSFDSPPIRQ